MDRSLKSFLALFLAGITFLEQGNLPLWAHPSLNSGDSGANSPLDSSTCNDCHNAGSTTSNSSVITLTGLPAQWAASTSYSLTLTVASGGSDGFKMSAESANAKQGTFTAGSSSHALGTGTIGQSGTVSGGTWSFSWKSPADAAGTIGTITFYVVGMKTSSYGSSSEAIYMKSFPVPEGAVAPPSPPTITTQPSNKTVTAGQTANFSIVASGTGLSYQWKKAVSGSSSFSNISGAIAASYTTPATVLTDSGSQYQCTVTNSAGSVTSSNATLTVNSAPPAITTQPGNQSVSPGQTASFSVSASGTAPLTYKWQIMAPGSGIFSDITPAATAASYTTPATALTDSGTSFQCVVTNSAGTVTSNTATLTVTTAPTPPSILTAPAAQSVTAGLTATFSVSATGTAPLSYQWKKAPSGSSTFSNISGAIQTTYTTPATATTDNGSRYECLVTNSAGNITSAAATLTVSLSAPVITTPPADQSVAEGQSATFSVTATGGSLSYQWQSAPAGSSTYLPISGAISSSYTTPPTIAANDDGNTYECVVTNTGGTATSSAATLSVSPAPPGPPTIAQQPAANVQASIGQPASFTVVAVGNPAPKYKWYRDGVALLVDAVDTTYTVPVVTATDNGARFYCVITNSNGSITSSAAQLIIAQPMPAPQISNLQSVMSLKDVLLVGTQYGTPVTFNWSFTKTGTVSGFAAPGTAVAAQTVSATNAFAMSSLALTPGQYQLSVSATDIYGNVSPTTSVGFTLLTGDLTGARVYPNPWRSDRGLAPSMIFDRLTPNATVKIFTVSGHIVKSLSASNGQVPWDLTNDSGDKVASGIYVYLITDDTGGKTRGKLAVIR